jgi:hypothetical protein
MQKCKVSLKKNNMEVDERINSQKVLKPKMRLPYQTTKFIYEALDVAEEQIKDLLAEVEELKKDK